MIILKTHDAPMLRANAASGGPEMEISCPPDLSTRRDFSSVTLSRLFTDPKWIEGGRKEMEVNFLGTFAVTQAFAPVLDAPGGGEASAPARRGPLQSDGHDSAQQERNEPSGHPVERGCAEGPVHDDSAGRCARIHRPGPLHLVSVSMGTFRSDD